MSEQIGNRLSVPKKIPNITIPHRHIVITVYKNTMHIFALNTFCRETGYENKRIALFPAYSSIMNFEDITAERIVKITMSIIFVKPIKLRYDINISRSVSVGSNLGIAANRYSSPSISAPLIKTPV